MDCARRSARVLLVDADGRVLLLRSVLGLGLGPGPGDAGRTDAGGHDWSAPGCPVAPGEDPLPVAVRALHEQVGLVVAPEELRPAGADVFLLRRARFGLDTVQHTDWGRGHRWWTVSDLQYTSETVHPVGLAGLLQDVLADRLP